MDLQVGVLGFIGMCLPPTPPPLSSSDRRSSTCARDTDWHTGRSMHNYEGAFARPRNQHWLRLLTVVLPAISTHSLVSCR